MADSQAMDSQQEVPLAEQDARLALEKEADAAREGLFRREEELAEEAMKEREAEEKAAEEEAARRLEQVQAGKRALSTPKKGQAKEAATPAKPATKKAKLTVKEISEKVAKPTACQLMADVKELREKKKSWRS